MSNTNGSTGAPRVSVVMAVHNGLPYVREAIESILEQTFGDFEFIIVDDGSTDDTPAVLAEYAAKDPRIRVITNETNRGLAGSLAVGTEAARGEFIARIDADDKYLPDRLERMVAYLDEHPEIGVLGTAAKYIDINGEVIGRRDVPTSPDVIRRTLPKKNCMMLSVLMRRDILMRVGGYRAGLRSCEDYDLWLRMSEVCGMANLPEPLYLYRRCPGAMTVQHFATNLAYHKLVKQFAHERREKGADSYEEYLREGKFPEASTEGADLGLYHCAAARVALNSGEMRVALREIMAAFRASPFRFLRPLGLFCRLAIKWMLVKVGLFRLVKRLLYRK